jgi:membrane protease subunit HflC
LGEPRRTIRSPGLYFKVPFIEQVHRFDDRLLYSDADPGQVFTQDNKILMLDNFARWRITDPLKFLQSMNSVRRAQSRLDDIIYSRLREEMGKMTLSEMVSGKRGEIMTTVTAGVRQDAIIYGIEILDVRIKRVDLPPENEAFVYDRMKAERTRQAKEYRAEGEEAALTIRAETDLEVRRIKAGAYLTSQNIRGEGDAEALRIYADAFEQDPKFYSFTRTLEAYEKTLMKETVVVLPVDSQFFKYLGRSTP